MSGHSKWSTIKHKKGKADAKRGKIFTKLGREIAVAVKEGGSSPSDNSRLRDAITKAKSNNMPNETIERSIKKASGELDSINFESVTYEGYGVGGVAVIVEALTDNRNRTASDVRHGFDKYGGSLGATGCVSWMFAHKGVLAIENTGDIDEDDLLMAALEAGAQDIVTHDEVFEITTHVQDFSAVHDALEALGFRFLLAELQMVPENTVELTQEKAETIQKMLDMIEESDDVQNVHHNGVF